MTGTRYLVDTSAVVRFAREPELRGAWRAQFAAGAVAICSITELEFCHSAQSKAHLETMRARLARAYVWVVVPDRVFERALSAQEGLTRRGTHRSAGAVDLLVAATAEAHGMTLLHYDADFLQVAEVTGQSTHWVADPGSVN